MLASVGNALTEIISMIGEVITSLTGEAGALSPLLELFGLGIAISLFFVAIKAVRSVVWGA